MWRKIEDRALAYELMQAGLLWWDFCGDMVLYTKENIEAWKPAHAKWMEGLYGPEDNYILLEG